MSRTTRTIKKICRNLESISGLDGIVADYLEELLKDLEEKKKEFKKMSKENDYRVLNKTLWRR